MAPIISDAKWDEFKLKLASTLMGLATIGHYDFEGQSENLVSRVKLWSIVFYILIPALIIIPGSVIVE